MYGQCHIEFAMGDIVRFKQEPDNVPAATERLELQGARFHGHDSGQLNATLMLLANDLRSVATRIEAVVVDLDALLREFGVSATPRSAAQAATEGVDAGNSPGRPNFRRILADNWIQIVVGMAIAFVAIVITLYLFSRPL